MRNRLYHSLISGYLVSVAMVGARSALLWVGGSEDYLALLIGPFLWGIPFGLLIGGIYYVQSAQEAKIAEETGVPWKPNRWVGRAMVAVVALLLYVAALPYLPEL